MFTVALYPNQSSIRAMAPGNTCAPTPAGLPGAFGPLDHSEHAYRGAWCASRPPPLHSGSPALSEQTQTPLGCVSASHILGLALFQWAESRPPPHFLCTHKGPMFRFLFATCLIQRVFLGPTVCRVLYWCRRAGKTEAMPHCLLLDGSRSGASSVWYITIVCTHCSWH